MALQGYDIAGGVVYGPQTEQRLYLTAELEPRRETVARAEEVGAVPRERPAHECEAQLLAPVVRRCVPVQVVGILGPPEHHDLREITFFTGRMYYWSCRTRFPSSRTS